MRSGGLAGTLEVAALTSSLLAVLCVFAAFSSPAQSVGSAISLTVDPSDQGASEAPWTATAAGAGQDLASIVRNIPAVSRETRARRDIAQATFCLPQSLLGILYYAFLQVTGNVAGSADMNEMKIIVTRTPFGASLGRFIFVDASILTEGVVRHEYGHTMQGYRHGPFFLLAEGLVSFVQAGISLISRLSAEAYFDRWPEDEADVLGGVTSVSNGPPNAGYPSKH